MNLHEMSQPVTAAKLNNNLEKKFGERIKLEKFTLEQLQDFRNHARTEIFQVETNESFNSVNTSDKYQKNKIFLDILNAEIAERESVQINEKTVPLDEKNISEATAEITGFRNDKEKSDAKSLAKQMGLKVSDSGKNVKISGAQKKISDLSMAAQKQGFKIEESVQIDEKTVPLNKLKRGQTYTVKMNGKKGKVKVDSIRPDGGDYRIKMTYMDNNIGKKGESVTQSLVLGGDDDVFMESHVVDKTRKADNKQVQIEEKAVSKAQQKAAGAALSAKRGKTKVSDLKGASKKMHKMSTSDLEDFASTKHKNLPAKKTKESIDMSFEQKPHGHLESQMQQRQLATIEDAVDELDDLISHAEELPEWVKKKIILATSYVDTVRDYMKSAEAIKRSMDPDTNASTDVDFDIESGRAFQFESVDSDKISNTRAEIIIAAKGLVDKITSWMEDTGEMQTDSMLSLSDSIREEIGEKEAKQFIELLKPGIEELYSALENTREIFIDGVNLVAGEEVEDMPGSDLDDIDMDLDAEEEDDAEDSQDLADIDDPFAATAAAAGGTDSEGREKRESISRSHRLLNMLSSKKK